jgi:hypothetical protein
MRVDWLRDREEVGLRGGMGIAWDRSTLGLRGMAAVGRCGTGIVLVLSSMRGVAADGLIESKAPSNAIGMVYWVLALLLLRVLRELRLLSVLSLVLTRFGGVMRRGTAFCPNVCTRPRLPGVGEPTAAGLARVLWLRFIRVGPS